MNDDASGPHRTRFANWVFVSVIEMETLNLPLKIYLKIGINYFLNSIINSKRHMHPLLLLTHQRRPHGVKEAEIVELVDDFEVEVVSVVPVLLVMTEESFVFVDEVVVAVVDRVVLVMTEESFVFVDEVVSVALVDLVVVVELDETKQEHAEEIRL
jgi:hypothetical protein